VKRLFSPGRATAKFPDNSLLLEVAGSKHAGPSAKKKFPDNFPVPEQEQGINRDGEVQPSLVGPRLPFFGQLPGEGVWLASEFCLGGRGNSFSMGLRGNIWSRMAAL